MVLAVTFSGIAATLLEGVRTGYFALKLPIKSSMLTRELAPSVKELCDSGIYARIQEECWKKNALWSISEP